MNKLLVREEKNEIMNKKSVNTDQFDDLASITILNVRQ